MQLRLLDVETDIYGTVSDETKSWRRCSILSEQASVPNNDAAFFENICSNSMVGLVYIIYFRFTIMPFYE